MHAYTIMQHEQSDTHPHYHTHTVPASEESATTAETAANEGTAAPHAEEGAGKEQHPATTGDGETKEEEGGKEGMEAPSSEVRVETEEGVEITKGRSMGPGFQVCACLLLACAWIGGCAN